MNLEWLTVTLLQAAPDPQAAAGDPAAQQSPLGGLGGMLVPMLAVMAVWYFLLIYPESKKRKERELKLKNNLKKGDTVVTNGGVMGKVWRIDGQEVVLVLDKDKDVKVRFVRNAIYEILPEDGPSKEVAESAAQEKSTS